MLSDVKILTVHGGTEYNAKDVRLHASDAMQSISQLHCLRLETEQA